MDSLDTVTLLRAANSCISTCENTAMPNPIFWFPAAKTHIKAMLIFTSHPLYKQHQLQWAIAIGKISSIESFFTISTCRKEAKRQNTTTAIVSGNSLCQQQTAQSLLLIVGKPALLRRWGDRERECETDRERREEKAGLETAATDGGIEREREWK